MARRSGCESAARSLPTPFLTKTYQLVDDHTVDDVISWNDDGSGFVVWNQTEFSRDLLPKYFKHNNFSSFVRQLNTYGFRKVVPDRWEFSNDCFRRGEKNLLGDIQRRKIAAPSPVTAVPATAVTSPEAVVLPTPIVVTPTSVSPADSGEEQVISSSDSPILVRGFDGSREELIGENEKLRKQNVQLSKEICQMKNMCNSICNLMSNFSGDNSSNGRREYRRRLSWEDNPMKPLNLLPMSGLREETDSSAVAELSNGGEAVNDMKSAAEELSSRLFGVPIGLKRGRDSERGPPSHGTDLRLQQPGRDVKSEPLDGGNNSSDQPSSWLKRSSSGKVCR